ncbi:Blue copper protein [Hibiscus syriacus]|uniref:Blue copper protein n=1 Tax=Hibiscus syriacus TaxID=106335 RepID=A0A6A2WYD1_HIBSY|nr:Blue copper protein [Hibiscus syriacus]
MGSSSVGLAMACLLLVSCMVMPSLVKVYTVGDASGWTTGVDYSTWTGVFKYPTSHTVDEVSSSDYSTGTVGDAITKDDSGATTVALKKAGTHYICGVVGHCANGMKLAVKVESGSSNSPASSDKPSTTNTTTTKAPDSSSWNLSPFMAVVTTVTKE